MDIKFSYKGRPWGTIQLEVGPSEGTSGQEIDRVPARPLDAVQLDTPDRIACVSLRYQIAQKIHACTEVFTGRRGNERFRDLIDIELLRELLPANALPAVRDACVEIFELRRKHQWPPTLTVGDTWADGFRAMAREIAFDTDDVEISATRFRVLVNGVSAPMITPTMKPAEYFQRNLHKNLKAMEMLGHPVSRRSVTSQSSTGRFTTKPGNRSASPSTSAHRSKAS